MVFADALAVRSFSLAKESTPLIQANIWAKVEKRTKSCYGHTVISG